MKHSLNPSQSQAGFSALKVRVAGQAEIQWFDSQLGRHHYLGAGQAVGDYLRQVVEGTDNPWRWCSRMFMRTLLPENAEIVTRGGAGQEAWGHPLEKTAQYNHISEGRLKPPICPLFKHHQRYR